MPGQIGMNLWSHEGGWMPYGELAEAYAKLSGIDGKKPCAIEVRDNRREARFLFQRPNRDHFDCWRAAPGAPLLPIFIHVGGMCTSDDPGSY